MYFASFGQGASNVRSVTVKPFNWSVINGTFYPGDMQSFSIASYPQMTNGSVVFTNQLLGIPFTLTISTLYDSYSTNYCISTNAVADGTGTINCANWVGTFNGIQFFYANVFIGGSGTNSGLTYNFSGNFSVTSNTNVDIGPNVFTNGGQILDAPTGLGQLSIATATRSLNDSSGAAAALWGNRMLYGKLFTPALDWQNLVGYGAWTWMNAGNVFAGTFTGNVANTTNGAGVSMSQVLNTNTLLGMAAANLPAGVVTNLNQILLLNTNGSSLAWKLTGLTDAQRGTNLVSALAALEIGGYLEVPAGSFLIHNLANYIPQASTIKFDGSYLYIDATSSSSLSPANLFTNILFYSDFGVGNWSMIGPATFDGMLVPCPTVNNGFTGKSAICVQSGIDRNIQGITFTNWSGNGFWNPDGAGYGLGQNSGSVNDCIFHNCQNGLYIGGEYWSFVNNVANGNTNGSVPFRQTAVVPSIVAVGRALTVITALPVNKVPVQWASLTALIV